MAVRKCNKLFGQDQHSDLDAVQKLLLGQMPGVGVDPVDEVLNLVNEGRHPVEEDAITC